MSVTDSTTVLAVEALAVGERAERTAENADALAQAAYGTAAKAESDAEAVRRAVASRWILDNLGDQAVWIEASIGAVAKRLYDEAYAHALSAGLVRISDWLDSLDQRGYKVNAGFRASARLNERYIRNFHDWRSVKGFEFRSRAEFQASRERAANERGEEAEREFIASVVQLVAEDVTTRLGFDFWSESCVSVEYEPDNPDGPYRWTAYPR